MDPITQVKFATPELLIERTIEVVKWQGSKRLKSYLQKHGVEFVDTDEYSFITFPAETRWARSLPVTWDDYARFILPDGVTIYMIYMSKGRSIISTVREASEKCI